MGLQLYDYDDKKLNFKFAFLQIQISTIDDFLRSHFFVLPNTFIYESILIQIYMNANYYDRQIFHLNKDDLKGY